MSTYMYGLKSPRLVKKVLVQMKDSGNISQVECAGFQFLFSHAYSDRSKMQKMRLGRIESMWDGVERLNYAAYMSGENKKLAIGDSVFFWSNGAPVLHTDGNGTHGNGVLVGKIVEIL